MSLSRLEPTPIDHVRLDHVDPAIARTFIVNWCLTSICNYSCSYCPDGLHDRKTPFPTVETVLRALEQIQAQRPGHEIAFELTGGEVTAWPQFVECAAELKKRGAFLSILSNGSRNLAWWEKAIPHLDKVILSFHCEFANFDAFLEVADLLRNRVSLHVNVIMHPRRFAQCLSAARILSEMSELTVALQPVQEDLASAAGTLVSYTAEQLGVLQDPSRYLREPVVTRECKRFRGQIFLEDAAGERTVCTPQEILSAGLNRWRGWACSIGLQQVAVNLDGTVLGGYCRQGGVLGNMLQGSVKLPVAPTSCGVDACACYFDIQCTKQRMPRP